ncbi:hypothetical protein [Phycicoccus avicenniae]|uniref:hypothetical protein n=1 Tax=Phycicoccus avicenniae TaxID=2828860 RepID=UPI003D2CF64E
MGLLPTLLAVWVLATMLLVGAPSKDLTWTSVTSAFAALNVKEVGLVTVTAIALAVTLQPLQFRMVQLLEGYWPVSSHGWAYRLGLWRQTRRFTRLEGRLSVTEDPSRGAAQQRALEARAEAAMDRLEERFPSEDRLLPTALGNALRAAEDRSGRRYGLQSVVVWPRLYPLLPAHHRSSIEDEVTQLDVSSRLAVTWSFTGLLASAIVLRDLQAALQNPRWWLVVGAIWALAWLSYHAAVESAVAHGLDIEVAFDLYRSYVVEAMRLPASSTLSEERRVLAGLTTLFETYDETHDIELIYRKDHPVADRADHRT